MFPNSDESYNIDGAPFTEGCQLKCVPKFAEDEKEHSSDSLKNRIKRLFALPWNRYAKRWLKRGYNLTIKFTGDSARKEKIASFRQPVALKDGDIVRVRSEQEIMSTLDPFNELKGCSFLGDMHRYCGTNQRVHRSMRYFMDERDYKLKKTRGLILLENVLCNGAPVFGTCDRCCFLFWREEWLEKIL